jgi:hypothetical protein
LQFVLIFLKSAVKKMDRRKFPSDKSTMSSKRKRLFITLEQKFGVTEQHEHAHSD